MASRTQAALFFDDENIRIGMEKVFGAAPDLTALWESVSKRFAPSGSFVISKAYADWERFPGAPAELQRLAIEPVYVGASRRTVNAAVGVAKNAADIQLALDAQELVYTRKDDRSIRPSLWGLRFRPVTVAPQAS
ncbi:MAG TPA: NYN domain-containing protein [Dehalococcoidia bacterium]|nr:NYN domain-containing protein [Dehalococcoidia bacterium]